MTKKIMDKFKNLDEKVKKIMLNGFKFAFSFCIFATCILAIYHYFYRMPLLYQVGTILFKASLMFFVDFIILGISFDTIKKQMA